MYVEVLHGAIWLGGVGGRGFCFLDQYYYYFIISYHLGWLLHTNETASSDFSEFSQGF